MQPHRLRPLLALATIPLLSHPAPAASFPCSAAHTPQEKTICAHPELSVLDDQLAAAYKHLRAQLSPAGAAAIQSDQRDWLRALQTLCARPRETESTIASCLAGEYSDRITALSSSLHPLPGRTLFPRLRILIAPDTRPPQSSSDPGFGIGRISWLEVDNPTPSEKSFNRAALMRSAEMVRRGSQPSEQGPIFSTNSVAEAQMEVSTWIVASNATLLQVVTENNTYDDDAVDPYLDLRYLAWWLEQGRALQPEDVFRAGSGWQNQLIIQSLAFVDTDPDYKGVLDDETSRQAAALVVVDPSNWILDRDGMEIYFPAYSIAGRAPGMPVPRIPWSRLKPFLAPTFNPAQLPSPENFDRIKLPGPAASSPHP